MAAADAYVLPPPHTPLRTALSDLHRLTRDVASGQQVLHKPCHVSSRSPRSSSPQTSRAELTARATALAQAAGRDSPPLTSPSRLLPRIASHPAAASQRSRSHGALTERLSHRPVWPRSLGIPASARGAIPGRHTVDAFDVAHGSGGSGGAVALPKLIGDLDLGKASRSTKPMPPQQHQRARTLDEYVLKAGGSSLGFMSAQLSWRSADTEADYAGLQPGEFYNHFRCSRQLTTKAALAGNLAKHAEATGESAESFFPTCYCAPSGSDRTFFTLHFRRLAALKVVLHHLRLDAERASGSGAQEYECDLDVLSAAGSALQDWCRELEAPDSGHCDSVAIDDRVWDAVVCYSALSELQLLGGAVGAAAGDPRCLPQLNAHRWGHAPLAWRPMLEDLLRCLERRLPQLVLQGGWQGRNIWIVKARGVGSKRVGVECANVLRDLLLHCDANDNCIVQKYVERPLLLFGERKFDIRQWVLLRSVSPLRIFVFSECYLRLCEEPYKTDDMHTQRSCHSGMLVQRAKSHTPRGGSKAASSTLASLAEFRGELRETTGRGDLWEEELEPQVRTIILHVLRAVELQLVPRKRNFELFAFDFAVDEFMHVWLLGVDATTGHCEGNAPFLHKLLTRLAQRLVEVVVLGHEDPDGQSPDWLKIHDAAAPAAAPRGDIRCEDSLERLTSEQLSSAARALSMTAATTPGVEIQENARTSSNDSKATPAEISDAVSKCLLKPSLRAGAASLIPEQAATTRTTLGPERRLRTGPEDARRMHAPVGNAGASPSQPSSSASSDTREKNQAFASLAECSIVGRGEKRSVEHPGDNLRAYDAGSDGRARGDPARSSTMLSHEAPGEQSQSRGQEALRSSSPHGSAQRSRVGATKQEFNELASSTFGIARKSEEQQARSISLPVHVDESTESDSNYQRRPRRVRSKGVDRCDSKGRTSMKSGSSSSKGGDKQDAFPAPPSTAGGGFDRDFTICNLLSIRYSLPVSDVKERLEEFRSFDADGNQELDREEFEQVIRKQFRVPGVGQLPKHLLNWHWIKADVDGGGSIDFEEYLAWTLRTQYTEEVMVPDPKERNLRHIARTHGIALTDVERLRTSFDRFDKDASGVIELDEFRNILFELLRVKSETDVSAKKLERWWREIDVDGSGAILFEEFLIWYIRNHEI